MQGPKAAEGLRWGDGKMSCKENLRAESQIFTLRVNTPGKGPANKANTRVIPALN